MVCEIGCISDFDGLLLVASASKIRDVPLGGQMVAKELGSARKCMESSESWNA